MFKRAQLLGVALVIALGLPACAPDFKSQQPCNFVQNSYGERVSWKKDLPVPIYIHQSIADNPGAMAMVQMAMDDWERAVNKRLFEIVSVDSRSLKPRQDGYSVIYWHTDWDGTKEGEEARTTIHWVGNRILEADIRVNAEDFSYSMNPDSVESPSKVHFRSLMVHELGHVLGLSHFEESAMTTSLAAGFVSEDRFVLKSDGIEAQSLRCEYSMR